VCIFTSIAARRRWEKEEMGGVNLFSANAGALAFEVARRQDRRQGKRAAGIRLALRQNGKEAQYRSGRCWHREQEHGYVGTF
jgi:hypothetical protein